MRSCAKILVPVGSRRIPCILPVYNAEPAPNMEKEIRPYSVVEVLKGSFKEDFNRAIEMYAQMCPEVVRIALRCPNAMDLKLIGTNLLGVDTDLTYEIDAMPIDLRLSATFSVCIPAELDIDEMNPNQHMQQRQTRSGEFRIRYLLDMRKCKRTCSAPIIAPAIGFPKDSITEQTGRVANCYLLPIMRAADYRKLAAEILNRFYREALIRPTAVDGRELARRMGLRVITVHFAEDDGILGQLFFDYAEISVLDEAGKRSVIQVKPCTILINKSMCRTAEVENSTIVHECVHMYKDRYFFLLQMMVGKHVCSYTSRKRRDTGYRSFNSPIEWMELQAEKLPAYILMEEKNTRSEIERMLAERGGNRSSETFSWILTQLASQFRVSRSMAKYRMIELGYPEAEGVYAYLKTGERVPDYGCSSRWRKGLTYAIAYEDAAILFRKDEGFRRLLTSSNYTYVEGHFVLNDPAYIAQGFGCKSCLTVYARHSIDECCIAFSVSGRSAKVAYIDGQVARKKPVTDHLLREHSFEAEPQTAERRKELDSYSRDAALWMQLLADMPKTFQAAVKKILDAKGLSQENLAARMGVTRAAFNKWWSRERISKEHVVCICLALEIRADMSMELLRISGNTLRNTGADSLYTMMLYDPRMTVKTANEILVHNRFQPLNRGEQA